MQFTENFPAFKHACVHSALNFTQYPALCFLQNYPSLGIASSWRGNEVSWNILWTDEAHFTLQEFINTQNCEYGQKKIHIQLGQYRCNDRRWCELTIILFGRAIVFERDEPCGSHFLTGNRNLV